jgi:biopolymer transport protein ExbD
MARKKKYRGQKEDDPGLDISSLIDVAFLMIFYFLVTSTLQPVESDLGMELPTDTPSTSSIKIDPMRIEIDAQGVVSLSGEVVESDTSSSAMPTLIERLRTYNDACKATETEPLVIVAANDEVSNQRFVDVLNSLAAVDVTRITLTGFRE